MNMQILTRNKGLVKVSQRNESKEVTNSSLELADLERQIHKLQDMLQVIYEKAEGHGALNWKSQIFGDDFKKQSKKEREAARERINSMTRTYIIRRQGTCEVKIGKSMQVEKRIRTLQAQSGANLEILAVIPKNIESMLHKQFAEFRTVGEWFDDSKGFIAAFAAKHFEVQSE